MHLETILNLDEFRLPTENTGITPFVVYAEQRIENYINHLRVSSADLFLNTPPQLGNYREYLKSVEELGHGLIQIMRKARTLNAHEAYPDFKKLMENTGLFMMGYSGAFFYIKPNDVFYRCKFNRSSTDLKPKEQFFHTPFNLSHLVEETRFTQAGIPALYLTNSMIGGYMETRSTQLSGFQGVKFQSKRPLAFLDLDYAKPQPTLRVTDLDEYNFQLQIKGLTYPLLLCSTALKNGPGAAPQEYIIPQMLLKWVRERGGHLAGIKYASTRMDHPHFEGSFYNLIIPPIEVNDFGHCEQLKNMFKISDPCGYFQDQLAIEALYSSDFTTGSNINGEINSIDWNSLLEIYNTSDIGKMEYYVDSLPANEIDF